MTRIRPLMTALVLATILPGAALSARPALRDVPEIENTLFVVAIADAVRDSCDDISGRVLRALGMLRGAKNRANDLGYSDREIRAYVDSDAEKDRMRAKGEAYLAQNGADLSKPETMCAFGRAEIAKNSAIGALLKAK